MLETILTRIILRYANKYICDTFHTDTFSLWGGDLVVHNFELRTEELAGVLGAAAGGLRLARGFVRELRVHVPWNAIRSQSLRVEVDAVEVVFTSHRSCVSETELWEPPSRPPTPTIPSATPRPTPPAQQQQQEGLDEASDTWLQPLLRTIFGNVAVTVNNLVAKLLRNGAVGCVTVGTLNSRPHSSRWEASFTPITGPQPMLHRLVSVRDITLSLDQAVPPEKRWPAGVFRRAVRHGKASARAPRYQVALPVLHRVSIEAFVEWPWLPWPGPVNPIPATHVDVHLSPVRVRLSNEQVQLLAHLMRPEDALRSSSERGADPDVDSESDPFSVPSLGCHPTFSSEPSTAVPTEAGVGGRGTEGVVRGTPSRQPSKHEPIEDTVAAAAAAAAPHASAAIAAAETSGETRSEGASEVEEPRAGGLRGFFADVLFGEDDEEIDEEERELLAAQPPREMRRAWNFAFCAPLLALGLEQVVPAEASSRDVMGLATLGMSTSPGSTSGVREAAWICTLSLVGLSAFAVAPPRSEGLPIEGSLELHHVALQARGGAGAGASPVTALAWGSPLARSPLEADDPQAPVTDSLGRARVWAESARRLLGPGAEFPHPSHCLLANTPAPVPDNTTLAQPAVRVGLLVAPPCSAEPAEPAQLPSSSAVVETPEEAVQLEVFRFSVQLAEVVLRLETAWWCAARELLQPFEGLSTAPATPPAAALAPQPAALLSERSDAAPPVVAEAAAQAPTPKALEAVVCLAGFRASIGPFALDLGALRADCRDRPHHLCEASLAASLRETTVFISSAFTHLPRRGTEDEEGALTFLRMSSLSLRYHPWTEEVTTDLTVVHLADLRDLVCTVAMLGRAPSPTSMHLEVACTHGRCHVSAPPVLALLQLASAIGGRAVEAVPAPGAASSEVAADGRTLSLEFHTVYTVLCTTHYSAQESAGGGAHGLAAAPARHGEGEGLGSSGSDSEADEVGSPELLLPARRQPERSALRATQLLAHLRRLKISFLGTDGSTCVIVAPYDLSAEPALLDTASRAAANAGIGRAPDAMLSLALRLCPAAPPAEHYSQPPALARFVAPPDGLIGAEVLRGRRQCCFVWLHTMHLEVAPQWIEFCIALGALAAPSRSPGRSRSEAPVHESPGSGDKESLGAALLCSVSGVVLPSQLWLTSASGPAACLTLPLVTAAEPQLHARGLGLSIFDEEGGTAASAVVRPGCQELTHPPSQHTLSELQRCLLLVGSTEVGSAELPRCLSLGNMAGSFGYRESLDAQRPLAALTVQLSLSPVQWRLLPSHVRTLLRWAQALQQPKSAGAEPQREADPVPRPQPMRPPATPGRLRVAVSLRVSASMDGTLEAPAGTLAFRLPCLSGRFHHVADLACLRAGTTLRVSRPHVVLSVPDMPTLDVVEWCEEKVHGDDNSGQPLDSGPGNAAAQRRAAYWLVLCLRRHGSRPTELALSTLPLGLCLALQPLLRLLLSFAAVAVDPPAPGEPATEPGEPATESREPHPQTVSRRDPAEREHEESTSTPAVCPDGGRMSMQASIGNLSVRLFASNPFLPHALHLGICVADAFAQAGSAEPPRARGVLSVSLFEQSEDAAEAPVLPAPPTCLVDDLLRPCALSFSERGPEPGQTGPQLKCLDADIIHLELAQRAHLCALFQLLISYACCLDRPAPATPAAARRPAPQKPPVDSNRAAHASETAGGFGVSVGCITVQLAGQVVGQRAPMYQLAASEASFTSTRSGTTLQHSVQCKSLHAALADETQSLEVAGLGVSVVNSQPTTGPCVLEATVSVEGGISAELCTGCLFRNIAGLWPTKAEVPTMGSAAAAEPAVPTELPVEPASAAESAAEPTTVKWRALLGSAECGLCTRKSDPRRLLLRVQDASIFSWPSARIPPPLVLPGLCSMVRQRMDISVETLSALASGPSVSLSPLLAPLSVHGSVMVLGPVKPCLVRARTEVSLRVSPIIISAGAWQIRLLSDVFSFKDLEEESAHHTAPLEREEESAHQGVGSGGVAVPENNGSSADVDESAAAAVPEGNASGAAEQVESLAFVLSVEGNGGRRVTASVVPSNSPDATAPSIVEDRPAAQAFLLPIPVLCSVSLEELEPWQAVCLEHGDACPHYAVRLDRPARVTTVAARTASSVVAAGPGSGEAPPGFSLLVSGVDFEVEAWDDSRCCFIDVSASGLEDAVCSQLVALRLPSLVGVSWFDLVVHVACPPTPRSRASELVVSVATPRLTCLALNSSACGHTAPLYPLCASVPSLEEPFGDISFIGFQLAFWQAAGEGMAVGVSTQRASVELYDLSTLSLTQVLVPEENDLKFTLQIADAKMPSLAPLRLAPGRCAERYVRRPLVDVALGSWRLVVTPWTIARLAHLGQSLAKAGSINPLECTNADLAPPRRLPIVVRNGLPVALVFGQTGTDEALPLSAGEHRAYAWRRPNPAARMLSFALRADGPWSVPVSAGCLPSDSAVLWAQLELPSSRGSRRCSEQTVHLCIRSTSRAQCAVMVLPPVLLFSHLPWDVEIATMQDTSNGPVLCTRNQVLSSGGFLHGLPVKPRLRNHDAEAAKAGVAAVAREVTSGTMVLPQRTFIGVLASPGSQAWLGLRRPGYAWGPHLPLFVGDSDPYATLVALPGEPEGVVQNVMCTCQDLWAEPREEEREQEKSQPMVSLSRVLCGHHQHRGAVLQPAATAPLPTILQLWPLLVFKNSCPFLAVLSVQPLGGVSAGPGESRVLESHLDPRQVKSMELQVVINAPTGGGSSQASTAAQDGAWVFSSGPLLLSGLTQFPHNDVDETVSWRNSVRCRASGCRLEALLLVEVRRCRLSSVLRSLAIEPMWSFCNETGEEVFFTAPDCGEILHVATAGKSFAASLGPCQHDPSFPFVALVGVRDPSNPEAIVWSDTPLRCAMGRTTRVEVRHSSSCFVALASVGLRRQQGSNGGGVHIGLFAVAYVRSEVSSPLYLRLGEGNIAGLVVSPAVSGVPVAAPWPWWPTAEATVLGDLVRPQVGEPPTAKVARSVALRICLDDGSSEGNGHGAEVLLDLSRQTGARDPGPQAAVQSLVELLAPGTSERLCSGHARDVCLDGAEGPRASVLLNLAHYVHVHGCFVLAVLRTLQPPLLCANFAQRAVWLSEPWRGASSAPPTSWRRMPPGSSLELPCPRLRMLEVFPAGGTSSGESAVAHGRPSAGAAEPGAEGTSEETTEVVAVRLSVEPDVGSCPHLDVALGADADVRWELPGLPSLDVGVRCVSGVCRLELREVEPGAVPRPSPAPLPLGSQTLPLKVDVTLAVSNLVVHLGIQGGNARQPSALPPSSDGSESAGIGRSLALHMRGARMHLSTEGEALDPPLHRDPVSRTLLALHMDLLSVADVGNPQRTEALKQVFVAPPVDADLHLACQPYGLPSSFDLVRVKLVPGSEDAAIIFCLDDSLVKLGQKLGADFAAEFAVEACTAGSEDASEDSKERELPAIPSGEFRYIVLTDLWVQALPVCVDLQLSSPVFLSFTGLALTFPEIRLEKVVTTAFILGQELLAHCIAFLLLRSPLLLGSCDLLGNPVQVYRHLRSGISDLLHRPLHDGVQSLARHVSSASLVSVSAVSDSIRRNLPVASTVPVAGAPQPVPAFGLGEGGLSAGARALLEGVSRGLVGVVRWEEHTPELSGPLGRFRGARNAVAGVVTHPLGGMLDFVTATARGWASSSASVAPPSPHPAGCHRCLAHWPSQPVPDVSPIKFHLQGCQGLPPLGSTPAVLYWSPHCELVRVDGAGGRREANLRLIRAGLLLTTAQLCVLVDAGTAHVLDVGAVQAAEEARTRPSALVTIASTAGQIWQLHVRGEPGEFVAHLRRARRVLGLPPVGAS